MATKSNITKDMIRQYILDKHTTLWGLNGDTTQPESLEALVDWQYQVLEELATIAHTPAPWFLPEQIIVSGDGFATDRYDVV